jgi:hypothetical protein
MGTKGTEPNSIFGKKSKKIYKLLLLELNLRPFLTARVPDLGFYRKTRTRKNTDPYNNRSGKKCLIFPELIFSELEFLEKYPIFPELKFRVFEFWKNVCDRSQLYYILSKVIYL